MKLFHLSFLVLATFTAAISAGTLFSYAPTINVACPSSSLVRKVDSRDNLDGREVKYISSRQTVIKETFQKWIGDGSALGYRPFPALQGKGLSNAGNLPKIGLATSGGGFRAAQCGFPPLSPLQGPA
jgi:lysophospholipase